VHLALLLAAAVTTVEVVPNPPRFGEPATVHVEVANPDPVARTVAVRADIGGAAMLRQVPQGASVARPRIPVRHPMGSPVTITWPQLVVPPNGRARVASDVILRYEYAADTLVLRATATDLADRTEAVGELQVTAVWPPIERPSRKALFATLVAGGIVLSALLWPSALWLWRFGSRPERRDRGAIRGVATALLVGGTVAGIVLVLLWYTDIEAIGNYREATCGITDRALIYESRPIDDERKRGFAGTTYRYAYRPLFAVEVQAAGETRWAISGDSDSIRYSYIDEKAAAELARFEPGRSYPCWYAIDDRQEVLLERRSWRTVMPNVVLSAVFLLLATPGLVWLVRRRT
jgi:hypothetical protein